MIKEDYHPLVGHYCIQVVAGVWKIQRFARCKSPIDRGQSKG